jgi:hypothetical protein
MKNLITIVIASSIVASSGIVYAGPVRSQRPVPKNSASKLTTKIGKRVKAKRLRAARPASLLLNKKKPARPATSVPVINRCKELDMNDDHQINSADRDLFAKGLTHIIQKTLDSNGDHYVNVLDLTSFAANTRREIGAFSRGVTQCVEASHRYDANGDGSLDVLDLVILSDAGRLTRDLYTQLNGCILGEFNYNGDDATNVLDIVSFVSDQMLEQQAFTTAAMAWIQGEAHDIYDINNDSNLNVADVVLYIHHYMTCTAAR